MRARREHVEAVTLRILGAAFMRLAVCATYNSIIMLLSEAEGFQMHMLKPVEVDELIRVIASLAGRANECMRK
jgi:uncharacterized protein (DUF927 family)